MTAPFVPDAAIRLMAWGGAYERGAAYARGGAVRRIAWDEASQTLTGLVAGSSAELYRCTIRLRTRGGNGVSIVSAQCTCPMVADCKHAVATLLRSNAGAAEAVHGGAPSGSASSSSTTGQGTTSLRPAGPLPARPGPPEPPGWRSVLLPPRVPGTASLALGVELRVRESAQAAHWGPRRVRTATARDLAASTGLSGAGGAGGPMADVSVGLRPLTRSRSTGAWIRSEVSWDALRRGGGLYLDHQLRWFTELYGIAHDVRVFAGLRDESEWITLDAVDSTLLWPQLARANDLDIPIVPAAKRLEVGIGGTARVEVVVEPHTGGALRLAPRIELDGQSLDPTRVRPIGHSGVYAFETAGSGIRLTLAPTSAPLGDAALALLEARAPVVVPASDTAEFLGDAYARLARDTPVVAAGGIALPDPARTTLVATVAFHQGDTIHCELEWHRAGDGRSPWPVSNPDDEDQRDLRAAVADAWAHLGDPPATGAVTFVGLDAAEFAAHVLPALEQLDGVRVEVTGRRREYRELTGDPRITVKTVESTDPDWFDLGIIVEIDGRRIPFTPLFTALALRRKKLLLSDGGYFSLAHPALDRLRELIDEAGELAEWESGPKISRYQLPLWEDFEDLADEAQPALSWRAAVDGLRAEALAPSADAHVPLPVGLRAQLRPYQHEGFDRLALWWRHRLGGILADDMGLGKTVQVLALLAHAREQGESRPFLVVAPTSVLSTWRDEAARFAPDLRVRVADATSAKSGARPDADGADVVVTSYTLLRLDEDAFAAAQWAIVVLDEAQFVKNPRTRLHRAVQALRADMVLAVTGTPLENSLSELWALLSLTCPGLFASPRRFREEYVKPIEQGKVPENEEGGPYRERRLARLRQRLHPFVLRRTKELVAPELPERQEQELRIELSPAHRAVYDTVLQRERQKVLGLLDDLDRNRFIVFRSLTLLRLLALAPSLVDAAGDAHGGIRSSKLDALRERIDELVAEGHRALVFSQFTSFLDLVRADLEAHGIPYAYLDGSTRRRGEVVDAFRTGTAPVFLISLKAGGFGLTLTEADYVFLLDPWWNPAAEAQAVDRTHRIGQTRPVNVYRLIASGTIEEKVLALQQRKARLFRAVMGEDELLARALTADDIRDLLES